MGGKELETRRGHGPRSPFLPPRRLPLNLQEQLFWPHFGPELGPAQVFLVFSGGEDGQNSVLRFRRTSCTLPDGQAVCIMTTPPPPRGTVPPVARGAATVTGLFL